MALKESVRGKLRPPFGATATDYAPWKDFVEQFSKILPHVDFDRAYDFLVRNGPLVVEVESSTEERTKKRMSWLMSTTRRRVESVEGSEQEMSHPERGIGSPRSAVQATCEGVGAKCLVFAGGASAAGVVAEGEAAGILPPVVSMAARRCASGVSARRFGLTLGIKVHHTKVVRREILLASSIQAARQMWYADREVMLYEVVGFALRCTFAEAMRLTTMKLKRKFHTTAVRSLCCRIKRWPKYAVVRSIT